MSLFWRVFVLNAIVFLTGTIALAVSPATVSFPVAPAELTVLLVGLGAILVVNLLLARLSFEPLRRLTTLMRKVDLLESGQRLEVAGPAEVAELVSVFNEMLGRLEEERQDSTRRRLEAQEEERKRISKELHDEIGQALTALLLQLNRLAKDSGDERRRRELLDAQESVRATLDEVRGLARRLRPELLDDVGLASALTALTTRFSQQTGVRVVRRLDPELPELDADVELALYRVAQESLTNVARHAQASRVELRLARFDGAVELRVQDNGVGLDGSEPGNGVLGMRERAVLVGGTLTLADRQGGGGAEVVLEVPVEQQA